LGEEAGTICIKRLVSLLSEAVWHQKFKNMGKAASADVAAVDAFPTELKSH
jgi:hypothetical protein